MELMNWLLTKEHSSILKGIAIIGMLCWHLFYCDNPVGMFFPEATRYIGILGDVCVSLFLFVSGYGMAYTLAKSESVGGAFYCKTAERLIKFYFSFWPVFIIVVPIGILIFHKPMVNDSVSFHGAIRTWLLQFFALSGYTSYNASWWYNSLIIPLYLLSPLLYWCCKKMPVMTIVASFIIDSLHLRWGVNMGGYLPIYIVGMIWYLWNSTISNCLNIISKRYVGLISIFFLALLCLSFLFIKEPYHIRGLYVYGLMTICLTLSTVSIISDSIFLSVILSFLGRHSANIYFVHTLIFYYWFPELFYSLRYPIVILGVLMIVSIGISYMFDNLKKRLRIPILQSIIIKKTEMLTTQKIHNNEL